MRKCTKLEIILIIIVCLLSGICGKEYIIIKRKNNAMEQLKAVTEECIETTQMCTNELEKCYLQKYLY
jgi:uncharacterized protein YneF (UPF0154 family)